MSEELTPERERQIAAHTGYVERVLDAIDKCHECWHSMSMHHKRLNSTFNHPLDEGKGRTMIGCSVPKNEWSYCPCKRF